MTAGTMRFRMSNYSPDNPRATEPVIEETQAPPIWQRPREQVALSPEERILTPERMDCKPSGSSRLSQVGPHSSLLVPVCHRYDRPQIALCNRLSPPLRGRQEQNCLLDVRREAQQVHDLADPRPGDVPQTRQVRVVGRHASFDQVTQQAVID